MVEDPVETGLFFQQLNRADIKRALVVALAHAIRHEMIVHQMKRQIREAKWIRKRLRRNRLDRRFEPSPESMTGQAGNYLSWPASEKAFGFMHPWVDADFLGVSLAG